MLATVSARAWVHTFFASAGRVCNGERSVCQSCGVAEAFPQFLRFDENGFTFDGARCAVRSHRPDQVSGDPELGQIFVAFDPARLSSIV